MKNWERVLCQQQRSIQAWLNVTCNTVYTSCLPTTKCVHELIRDVFVRTEEMSGQRKGRSPREVLFAGPDEKCQLPNENHLKLTKIVLGRVGQTAQKY